MLSFYRKLKTIITRSPAMLARVLLIMIFAMQSVAAMSDNCALEHQDCGNSSDDNSKGQVTELAVINHDALDIDNPLGYSDTELCDDGTVVIHVDDDCAECTDNCCSCCMTLMQPTNTIANELVHSDYVAFTFTSTAAESPYFSFLRPPQA